MSKSLKKVLNSLHQVDGFIAASLVEADTGMTLESTLAGPRFDIEVAGAINTNVVQAKRSALQAIGLDEDIEDIVITLGAQYHLMRVLPEQPHVFLYMALNRAVANIVMARMAMAEVTDAVVVDENHELMVEVIDELVGSAIDGIGPPERVQRAEPSYPRGLPKRAPQPPPPPHLKKPGDSPSCAFPRERKKMN